MLAEIQNLLVSELTDLELAEIPNSTPSGFVVPANKIYQVCEILHSHPSCFFDHLASLAGVDNGSEANTMEVVYTLYSYPLNQHLSLKVVLPREQPTVDSVSDIWRGANWHEREAFDLFGIQFTNHPDLRRILLPADWVGYPMRKDYEEDTAYHGMTIKHPDSLKP